jgi:hypothetical protein
MPIHVLAVLSVICLGIASCASPHEDKPRAASSNAAILDEINQARSWFHAKKVRPIWVRQLAKDELVKTIEGTEQVKAGDFLCRGEAGDVWPQSAKDLNKKYQKTEEVDATGWRKYVPHPDSQGVMAAQVGHAFTVQAKWGVLSGKAGDYIIKNFADRDIPYPDDVWIVDQKLFQATYEAIRTERSGSSSNHE